MGFVVLQMIGTFINSRFVALLSFAVASLESTGLGKDVLNGPGKMVLFSRLRDISF